MTTNSDGEDMLKEVLLVEDNPGDVRLTREAFRDFDKTVRLHVAVDGVDAMAFLRHEGVHVHAPRPDFILLDLNLPKMDGREVLACIKNDEKLKTIPTIILTTSDAEVDVCLLYTSQGQGQSFRRFCAWEGSSRRNPRAGRILRRGSPDRGVVALGYSHRNDAMRDCPTR